MTPHPAQVAFLAADEPEVFYGGAARGGKSAAQLMAALQYVDEPGYAALILRKTYTDLALPGAMLDQARQWLGDTAARWHDDERTWRFPSGATLTFGYLDADQDRFRYQSSAYQFVGFDELTHWRTAIPYLFLFSRLCRLVGSEVPIRMRSASNPGGPGHEWVRARFVTAGAPDRLYIPARVSDNPSVDQAAYLASLEHLDPVTRAQMRDGDWSVREAGGLFRREWWRYVDAVPPGHQVVQRVRAWDKAATESATSDWTVGARVALLRNGRLVVEHVLRFKGTPARVDEVMLATARADGIGCHVAVWQDPGQAGVADRDHMVRLLAGYFVHVERASHDKVTYARPISAQVEHGNVDLVRAPWNLDFVDEFEPFPAVGHDDQVDTMSLAGLYLLDKLRQPCKPIPADLHTMGITDEGDDG